MKKSRTLVAFMCVGVCCLPHRYSPTARSAEIRVCSCIGVIAQCSIMHLSDGIWGKVHYGIVGVLFFLTPFTARIFCCEKITKMIQRHNTSASVTLERRSSARVIIQPQFSRRKKISPHEIKLSKSLFVVVDFFFMHCWIPFWIIVILRGFHLVGKMPRNV